MSLDALTARAEVMKLARLLGQDPGRLGYLEGAAPGDLAALREQVTDALFEGEGGALRRIADAGRIVPIPVMVTIGERAFGPLLCARLTGLLDPDRAVEVAERLEPPFLAQVAAELDPRRAAEVIARMPLKLLTATAAEMAARGETVAMGRFVAHLPDAALSASIAALDDGALLRTAYVLDGKERLDRLIALLPDERLAGIVDTAAAEELWPEALDMLAHMGDDQLRRLASLTADRDPAAFAGLRAAATEYGAEAVLERARGHGLPLP